MPPLYHTTERCNAERILRAGFVDATGDYMIGRETSGVWFADRALDANDFGTIHEDPVVILAELALDDLAAIAEFEWIEEGKAYREWQVPAVVANRWSRTCEDLR